MKNLLYYIINFGKFILTITMPDIAYALEENQKKLRVKLTFSILLFIIFIYSGLTEFNVPLLGFMSLYSGDLVKISLFMRILIRSVMVLKLLIVYIPSLIQCLQSRDIYRKLLCINQTMNAEILPLPKFNDKIWKFLMLKSIIEVLFGIGSMYLVSVKDISWTKALSIFGPTFYGFVCTTHIILLLYIVANHLKKIRNVLSQLNVKQV